MALNANHSAGKPIVPADVPPKEVLSRIAKPEKASAEAQKTTPGAKMSSLGGPLGRLGKATQRGSERQRKVAAQTAQKLFTKYPLWLDPHRGAMVALSTNPFYDICRKVQDHAEGMFPLYSIDASWAGKEGRFAFVTYCFEHLPARPTPFHKIRTIDGTEFLRPGNVHWEFVPPSRKQLYRDEARLALATFGSREGGAVMPEGWLEKAMPYLACEKGFWTVPEVIQSLCLCSPDSYWPDCDCPLVTELRHGEPRIGELFAGSVRVAAEEDV